MFSPTVHHAPFRRTLPTAPRAVRGLIVGLLIAFGGLAAILFAEKFFRLSVAEVNAAPLTPISTAPEQFPRPRAPGGDSIVNGRSYQGEDLDCDFPPAEWIKNRGGSDGAGMCVMSSIEMSARWQGLEQMRGLREWCAQFPGGANPPKVDQQIAAFCRSKGIEAPRYLQYTGPNPESIIDLASRSGRMAAITYGWSPRYGHTISHMTCCPHLSGQFGVCLDNNPVGGVDQEHLFEWMSRDELLKRIKHPSGSGWVFVWLDAGPPPIPHPREASEAAAPYETFGPYRTRIVTVAKIEELRERGWRCSKPWQEGPFRWYFRASKR